MPAPSSRRDRALAALLGVCGLLVGIESYHHHFVHRDLQTSSRLPPDSSSYLATDPVVTAHGVLFVGMTPDGYRVLKQKNDAAAQLRTVENVDQLSFTATSNNLILEIADANGSRIVNAAGGATLADNAESPALSPDGRTLAYIREIKGRGALRTTSLFATDQDQQLTDENYDVREARFLGSSGALLMAARHQGHQDLFTVLPGQQPIPFSSAAGDIAAFAVSPEGLRIAFTILLHDRWQLEVFDVPSRRVTQLTENDCNAYKPAWRTATEIVYATDCGRGYGLTALAAFKLPR
jgi:Tol biopolymer transport system component